MPNNKKFRKFLEKIIERYSIPKCKEIYHIHR